MPLRLWDEIRLAWNAYEMMHNGEPFVTYFQGAPDMWNTKPPLLIWIEALSFSVLGPSEFSFRLPSVIAAFLTCYFLFRTTSNNMAAPWMGFIAVLLLVTTDGYLTIHAARSGNYEALLVLFM
ncbi:MAG: glycosyltransferase family 39 protein, partial [Flavobacteriales bacterium]|nr:glycosyltransferase family 39 protein [Flavobacteriales bacterium]